MPDFTSFKHGRFCWVDLMAHDMDAAGRFYADLFGWEVAEAETTGGPRYAMFTKGGKNVAGLGEMPADMKATGMPPVWSSYIAVDDVDATCQKVTAAGGTVMVPPMDIPQAGRMAVASDPTGGVFSLWQADGHAGVDVANEPGAWVWGELITPDPERAMTFYGEVFGWAFSKEAPEQVGGGEYWEHTVDGRTNGGLMRLDEAMPGVPPHWSVYVMADDADAAVAKVKAGGGSVMAEPFDTPVGRMAICADAQGAAVNVAQVKVACDGAP